MAVKPRAQRERKRFEIPFRCRRECRPRSQGCMRIRLQQSDSFTLSAACAEPMVLLRFAQTCWSDVAGPCANAVTSSDFLVITSDRPPGSPLFICEWRGWHMSLAICHPRAVDSSRTLAVDSSHIGGPIPLLKRRLPRFLHALRAGLEVALRLYFGRRKCEDRFVHVL